MLSKITTAIDWKEALRGIFYGGFWILTGSRSVYATTQPKVQFYDRNWTLRPISGGHFGVNILTHNNIPWSDPETRLPRM